MENKILQEEKGNEQVDMSFVNLAEGTLGKQIRNESIKKNLDEKFEAQAPQPKKVEDIARVEVLKTKLTQQPSMEVEDNSPRIETANTIESFLPISSPEVKEVVENIWKSDDKRDAGVKKFVGTGGVIAAALQVGLYSSLGITSIPDILSAVGTAQPEMLIGAGLAAFLTAGFLAIGVQGLYKYLKNKSAKKEFKDLTGKDYDPLAVSAY